LSQAFGIAKVISSMLQKENAEKPAWLRKVNIYKKRPAKHHAQPVVSF
jgi:ribosomal protein L13